MFLPRRGCRHVRHHYVSFSAQPVFDLLVGVVFHEIQYVGFSTGNRFDFLQVDTQNSTDPFARPFAQRVDAFDRDLAPTARRAAQINHASPGHEEAELVVQLQNLKRRATTIAFGLRAFHVWVVQLPLKPAGRAELAPARCLYLDLQVALSAA